MLVVFPNLLETNALWAELHSRSEQTIAKMGYALDRLMQQMADLKGVAVGELWLPMVTGVLQWWHCGMINFVENDL